MLEGSPHTNLKGVTCFLCVDKPAPRDLKHHIMFYHMVENDIAVEKIFWMNFLSQATTQTTVTWTGEFSYYDHRSELKRDKAKETKEVNPTLERKFHRKRRRINHSPENSLNTGELENNDCEIKKLKYQEKLATGVAQDLENNDKLALSPPVQIYPDLINEEEKGKQDEVSAETTSIAGVVKDFYDYGDTEEYSQRDDNKRSLYNRQMNHDSVPEDHQAELTNVLDDEESPQSVSVSDLQQDVVKKFGNSISIINIKDTNGLTSVDNSSEAVNELEFDSQGKTVDVKEESVGMEHDSSSSVEEENLESIEVTEKHDDEGDVKKTKTETLTVDNIQSFTEKLGISVSISRYDGARILKAESPERLSTNNQEEIKSNQSQTSAWCLETLIGNGTISVAKMAPQENGNESEENLDCAEIDGINIESEKEKTFEDQTEARFLSSDEENSQLEKESPLERLVNSGLLSINKIEEAANETNETVVPVKADVEIVNTKKTAKNSITSSKSTEVCDSESFIESDVMKDEAFDSDEEFDDDDYDEYY